jgi:hypothetical protein
MLAGEFMSFLRVPQVAQGTNGTVKSNPGKIIPTYLSSQGKKLD